MVVRQVGRRKRKCSRSKKKCVLLRVVKPTEITIADFWLVDSAAVVLRYGLY